MPDLVDTFRVLGDETRLRIMRLLLEESLNVGEMTGILGTAQSTVSKHLRELRKAGLVESQRKGGYTYYEVSSNGGDLWDSLSIQLRGFDLENGDLVRLEEIRKQREEHLEADRFLVPGRSWVAWSRALQLLLPPMKVADLGCGDGVFTRELARWAQEVIAVDANPAYLRLARESNEDIGNVRFLEEDMRQTSIESGSLDLVVISQSLHYLEEPLPVLQEAARIIKPQGRLLAIELFPHDQEWVKQELGHHWTGMEPELLKTWLESAGFGEIKMNLNSKRGPETFQSFVVIASRSGNN